MTHIITGATGFIGFALCSELIARGEEVIAVIRPNSNKKDKLSALSGRVSIIELDLEDLSKLHTEYHIQADVFYHLAWNGSSGADREDFDKQYVNVAYTVDAIRTAKACGCKRIIGAGSQAEYGVVREMAYEDKTVPNPFMMYGAAKTAAYQMGQIVAKQIGINLIWPRIYSVYGAGENPGTLVNYVMDSLRKGEMPKLSECVNMWNFMYITDCVDALILLGSDVKAEPGVYHIASSDTRLLKEFVEEIKTVMESDCELGFGVNQSNPQRTFWLEPNIDKISKLGFTCKVPFSEGIRLKLETTSK